MGKPEWGQKRACPGCGSRFYDLMHDPITCPNCGATVDPTAFSKTRRSRTVPVKRVAQPTATAETATVADEPAKVAEVVDDEEDDKDIIEDASELGEDENDVSEVVEGAEGKDVTDR